MTKPGSRPCIYIGSGTDALSGVSSRLRTYNKINKHDAPSRMYDLAEAGYRIDHKGLLCWAPIPKPSLQPRARLLFVALEATFSFVFWAMHTVNNDYGMSHLLPWLRTSLPFDGICTHCALGEPVCGDFKLSAAELEENARELKRRRVELQSGISSAFHVRQMATNHTAYLERCRKKTKTWAQNNPDKLRDAHRKSLKKAKTNKKYYCATCDYAAAKLSGLNKHNKTQRHKDLLAGIVKVPKQSATEKLIKQRSVQRVVNNKTYYCDTCDYAAASPSALLKHNNGPKHKARAANIGTTYSLLMEDSDDLVSEQFDEDDECGDISLDNFDESTESAALNTEEPDDDLAMEGSYDSPPYQSGKPRDLDGFVEDDDFGMVISYGQ